MKWKSAVAAVLSAVLMAAASGCSITDFGTDEMLRPPKTMGDEAEIEQLISKSAPNGYTLKYPKNGSYRSAIIMNDLDGDDTNEAIAFFREKDSASGVHMLVMYESDGKWNISADFITETTDVDCVDFADIDDNPSREIIVGYATYTPNVSFLSCYTFNAGKTDTIESGQNYSAFYCGSLDSNGKNKVITLTLFSPDNEAKATLLEYNSGRKMIYAKASAPMDPNIISYKNVIISDLGENIKGIVVDGAYSNDEMNTQVIYFNKELAVMRNPLYKEKSANPTQRNSAVISADIGNDMIIEIPIVSALPYSDASGAFTAADQIVWNTFSVKTETLAPQKRTAANYNYNYTIKVPENWKAGTFTAFLNESGNTMSFCEWKNGATGQNLFDIRVFKVEDWDQGKDVDEYNLIYKDNLYAYTYLNYNAESELAIDDNEIKTAFSLLNEIAM